MQFYSSTEAVSRVVAAFLGAGFVQDEPALVIATDEHRAAVSEFLHGAGFAVDALLRDRRIAMVDAFVTLDEIMVNGRPDPVRFETVAAALIAPLGGTKPAQIRVYDEMVDILWKRQDESAALLLETLWDRLIVARGCSLMCGHGPDPAGRPAQALFAHHSHVVAENGVPHPVIRM